MTLTWACVTNVTAGFYSALGDSCGSEDLSVIDGFWIGDSSPRCVHILPNLTGRAVQGRDYGIWLLDHEPT